MECNNCNVELLPVFPEGVYPGQYGGALHLRLQPGYGEYFDGNSPVDIFLCENCARNLLDSVMPNVKEHIYNELEKQGF